MKRLEKPNCIGCAVRGKSVFCSLSTEELDILNDKHSGQFYKKGQVLFFEGGHPLGVHVIYEGKVKLYKLGQDGKEQIIRLAKEGEILGYRSFLSSENYSATAEALENTVACFIPSDVFHEFLHRNNSFSLNLMKQLARDLGSAEDRLKHLAQDSVRERLAQSLLMLKDTFGVKEDGRTLDVVLSREDLANIVGTATETVIRLLSEFKKEGIIDLVEKKIVLVNNKSLVEVSHILD